MYEKWFYYSALWLLQQLSSDLVPPYFGHPEIPEIHRATRRALVFRFDLVRRCVHDMKKNSVFAQV